ncbi:aminoglycoside phosphotransferase family protein [Mesorhizobium sp. RP14(2022)]|uniref:Aminoglycoside phosphotransferase family protein n=1 Tax=Mesorhizobium liriopis TaxID=2953882 RepID=A0ABT1C6P6_9HYPH|nr:aminoglycoside phosphotransferase family protein [Mesorhizobium liriopis]MCO6050153.1 aminoglycoside phosphotransferase family protein [Mesorhizobium liriopis]
MPRYLRGLVEDGEPAWFIKIVSDKELPAARLEADLAHSLSTEGVVTPRFAAEIALEGDMSAMVFRWIEGAHPTAGAVDFARLGVSLNRLHHAFANVADRFSIEARTTCRLTEMEELAVSGRFEQRWEGCEHKRFALEMRDAFLTHLGSMKWESGAIHGDLNPGNIIQNGDTFAFLDFEDALHSRLWPGLDLAKIIERLILPSIAEKGRCAATGDLLALLFGYGLNNWPNNSPSIQETVHWHIGLSVLVITQGLPANSSVAISEIKKFIKIAEILKKYNNLLQ